MSPAMGCRGRRRKGSFIEKPQLLKVHSFTGDPRETAEEKLDGQRQRVDIPAHARATNKSLLQKRLEEDLC